MAVAKPATSTRKISTKPPTSAAPSYWNDGGGDNKGNANYVVIIVTIIKHACICIYVCMYMLHYI